MEDEIRENTITSSSEIFEIPKNEYFRSVGIIEASKFFVTQRGEIGKFTLRTLDDKLQVVLFASKVAPNRRYIYDGAIVIVSGTPNIYREEIGIVANSIREANRESISL